MDNIFLPLVLGRDYQEMEKRIATLAPKLHIEELQKNVHLNYLVVKNNVLLSLEV